MRYSSNLFISVGLLVLLSGGFAAGEVKLPAIISDHMVLQAGVEVPIWGVAGAGEEVAVSLSNSKVMAKADSQGRWKANLPPLAAGGPFELSVTASNSIVVKDVLVGEVWLGSGQSNMAMTVNRANDFEKESAAATFPQIRMFTVSSGPANESQEDCSGEWQVCSPATVARFSATAYFFGRELHRQLRVPVGLINSSVGGTPIESWISPEAQRGSVELNPFFAAIEQEDAAFDADKAKAKYERDLTAWKEATRKAKEAGKTLPRRPRDPIATRDRKGSLGGLFNGKIAPLIPYRIRGAVWYQGEANSTPVKARFYEHQLTLLISDWRQRWGYEFPFAWVQLPNFGGPGREWPVVREGMRKTLRLPNTGMAITIDIGETKDIHPKNKQEVGRRLALWALGTVYGKPGPTSGPLPESQDVRGSDVVVTFKHADGGLTARDGTLTGFEIGNATGFKPAKATIDGDKLILQNPEVARPTAIRYAWQNDPAPSLFNGAGLPASPFHIDIAK